jgi:hypothetical protein
VGNVSSRKVPSVAFRLTAEQRAAGVAEAGGQGISIGELARRRFLGTTSRAVRSDAGRPKAVHGDLRVEYDPVG